MSIVVEDLTYIYMKGTPFEKAALKNVTLSIQTGEFVGIIGHTGSGKSTLVQHFNGLLKPTSGRVLIDGIDVTGKNIKELRKQVGIVFQYPEHQLFEETVHKDIAFGLKKLELSTEEIEKRINETIETVGLNKDILEKSPFELSGGQKRRVAIAGVVAMKPKVLVLDEPTAGLDPKGSQDMFNLILRLHKESGVTVILVSHSMEDVAKLAKRVIVMNKGQIEVDGLVRDIFKDAGRLESIGLSSPQITYLMKKLKGIMPQINENVFTIDDAKQEIMKCLRRQVRND